MDPFVTARSITTPLTLFAIGMLLRRRTVSGFLLGLLACSFHPIMGACLVFYLSLLYLGLRARWRPMIVGCLASAAGLGAVALADPSRAVTEAYRSLILTRGYMFPALWTWYELVGVVLPILLLAMSYRLRSNSGRAMAAAAIASGTTFFTCAVMYVHVNGPYFLARVQILREFQIVYLAGLVLLGAWLGRFSSSRRFLQAGLFTFPFLAAVLMFASQRADYAGAPDIEAPGTPNSSPWHAGFLWLRNNTDVSTVLAADPNLMETAGEAHEGPRPASERSILASTKDGGTAILSPALAAAWTEQSMAEANLNTESDSLRYSKLSPYGVTWILLRPQTETSLHCAFQNAVVKLCDLRSSSLVDETYLHRVEALKDENRPQPSLLAPIHARLRRLYRQIAGDFMSGLPA